MQERVIEGLTDSTIASYQYALDRYLDKILQETLPEFFTYLRGQELSVHTIYGIRTSVRAFLRYIYQEGFTDIEFRVPRRRKPKRRVTALSPREVQVLMQACGKVKFKQRRNAMLIRFFYDTGLRMSECVNIKMGDIDWRSRTVRVIGKGSKERVVPFGHKTRKALWEYLKDREKYRNHSPIYADCLWIGPDGYPLTNKSVQEVFKKLKAKTGLPIHAHKFRHSFGLSFIDAGGVRGYLQRILGHEDMSTTDVYVNPTAEHLSRHHDKLSPGDKI